jgi:hypothetical protein
MADFIMSLRLERKNKFVPRHNLSETAYAWWRPTIRWEILGVSLGILFPKRCSNYKGNDHH